MLAGKGCGLTVGLPLSSLTRTGAIEGRRLPEHNWPSKFLPNVNTYTVHLLCQYYLINQPSTLPLSTTRQEWVGPIAISTTRCLPSSLMGVATNAWLTCNCFLFRMRRICPMKVCRWFSPSLLNWLLRYVHTYIRTNVHYYFYLLSTSIDSASLSKEHGPIHATSCGRNHFFQSTCTLDCHLLRGSTAPTKHLQIILHWSGGLACCSTDIYTVLDDCTVAARLDLDISYLPHDFTVIAETTITSFSPGEHSTPLRCDGHYMRHSTGHTHCVFRKQFLNQFRTEAVI